MLREVRQVDLVHRCPVGEVGEEYGALDDVVHVRAVGLEQRLDALHCGFRFRRDAALAARAEYARQIQRVADLDDVREQTAVADVGDVLLLCLCRLRDGRSYTWTHSSSRSDGRGAGAEGEQ